MPKVLPHREAQLARRHGLAVGDENRLAGCRLRREEVGHGEDVRVCDVVYVDVVLQVGAAAEDEGGLPGCDARVDDGDAGWVVGTEDGGGAEGTGGEGGGVGA